jgi:photosystem II stability/assembly factor-like uncharacterized protein
MLGQALVVALVAVVVGDARHLALTRDGRAWRESSPPHVGWIDDATFIDARHGWVVSEYCVSGRGMVARTVDGGKTWRSAPFGGHSCSTGSTFSLDFVDARHGWIVEYEAGGFADLWRTTDGGRRWQWLRHRLPGDGAVEFRTPSVGWLGGFDGLYRTHDAGRHWRRALLPGKHFGAFASPQFFGRSAVTAAVGDRTAAAFRTTDGGRHWRRTLLVRLPREPSVFTPVRLSAPERGVCWLTIRGRRSLLYTTANGGRTWARRPPLPLLPSGPLRAVDRRTAVLPVYRNKRAVVVVTHDGGRTWRRR